MKFSSVETMPLATDVTLPRDYKAVFPRKCLMCHGKPDATVRVVENTQGLVSAILLPILFSVSWARVEVPICRQCKARFRLQRWGRNLIFWVAAIVAVWIMMPYYVTWPRLVRMIAPLGLAVLVLWPYFLAEILWPRVIDITVRKDSTEYKFASRMYAQEFVDLNRRKILKADIEPRDISNGRVQ